MPRKRKTQSGAPAQPVGPVGGQMYGAGVEQAQLQRAMPAPQNRIQLADKGPGVVTGAAPLAGMFNGSEAGTDTLGASQSDSMRYEQAMAAAAQLKGQAGMLTMPTARPQEPITAGLSTGPGAGPEALSVRSGSPVGDAMRKLSARTGDPYFAALARKARM